MKAPSKEIYGKSTQRTYVEKYIHWVTMQSLTIRVYLHPFSCCCHPNQRNFPKIRTYSSSRSSKVTELGADRKCICTFLPPNFGTKLTPQKLEGWGYHTVKFHHPTFNCFCMIHIVWQTDRWTGDSISHAKHICYMLSRVEDLSLFANSIAKSLRAYFLEQF